MVAKRRTARWRGALSVRCLLVVAAMSFFLVVSAGIVPHRVAGRKGLPEHLGMRTDAQKQQHKPVSGLLVDENHVRADMAVSASLPVVVEWVVAVFGRKGRIGGEERDHIANLGKQRGIMPKPLQPALVAG